MAGRKPMSKRLRFEVFKRDGFKCVYCGAPPTAGVLHVDHIVPVAEGGEDSPDNLVTSCPDCNLGKSHKMLDKVAIKQFDPEVALEHAEQLRSWMEAQRGLIKTRRYVEQEMVNLWCDAMGTDSCDSDVPARLLKVMAEFQMEKLSEALTIVANKSGLYSDSSRLRYMYGILRVWREGGE